MICINLQSTIQKKQTNLSGVYLYIVRLRLTKFEGTFHLMGSADYSAVLYLVHTAICLPYPLYVGSLASPLLTHYNVFYFFFFYHFYPKHLMESYA